MPFAPAVVPCGPGYTVQRRRVLGYLACISCDSGTMTVTPDKIGKLRAYCLQSEGGCGSKIEIAGEHMPEHAAAALPQFADDISALPTVYREHLARSWCFTTTQLMDLINGTAQERRAVSESPEPEPEIPEPEIPEKPAETAGNSAGGCGAVASPAVPGAAELGTIGPQPGSGTGERIDQPPKRRGFLEW